MRASQITTRFDKQIGKLRWGQRFLLLALLCDLPIMLAIVLYKFGLRKSYFNVWDNPVYGIPFLLMLICGVAGAFIIKDQLNWEPEAERYLVEQMNLDNPLNRVFWGGSLIDAFLPGRWIAQGYMGFFGFAVFFSMLFPFVNLIPLAVIYLAASSSINRMRRIIQEDIRFFEEERKASLKNSQSGIIRTDADRFVYAQEDQLDFASYERGLERH
jgi:hypothetical protein